VELQDCIAEDRDDYLRKAVALASNLPALGALRASLRQRMTESPLMDAGRLARGLEKIYREAWTRFCDPVNQAAES
jgi:predicted O-linked N-acetylglucosamine transferase (SPINDLY family)